MKEKDTLPSDPDILEELIAEDQRTEIVTVMRLSFEKLSDKCKMILKRRILEGCEYQDIAKDMGVVSGTVRNNILRCREELLKEIVSNCTIFPELHHLVKIGRRMLMEKEVGRKSNRTKRKQ